MNTLISLEILGDRKMIYFSILPNIFFLINDNNNGLLCVLDSLLEAAFTMVSRTDVAHYLTGLLVVTFTG